MHIAYELPVKTLSNGELAALYPGWSEEKIWKKTGIRSRHVAGDGETAVDLAERAGRKLLSRLPDASAPVDFLLFCTQSPDYRLPSSACILQDRLGLPRGAGALGYDLGCSGYVYGLALAKGLLASGAARRVLLLTAETYTKYIHPMDKSARAVFGDGAAATLLDAGDADGIGAFSFGTDGSGARHLILPAGGAREPRDPGAAEETDRSGNVRTRNHLFMDGMEIFRFTLDVVPGMIGDVLRKNGLGPGGVDLFVFHQANRFMLEALRAENGIPPEKFYVDMEDTGNTVSSTIPIALARAEAGGALRPGMRVMVVGFGVGLSWGATVLTWRGVNES